MIIGTMINQEIQIRDKDKLLLTEIKNNSNIGLYLSWFLIIFAKLGLTKLSVILNIMSVLGCWISVFYSKQCIMNKWYITILKQIYIYLVLLLVFLMIDFIISVSHSLPLQTLSHISQYHPFQHNIYHHETQHNSCIYHHETQHNSYRTFLTIFCWTTLVNCLQLIYWLLGKQPALFRFVVKLLTVFAEHDYFPLPLLARLLDVVNDTLHAIVFLWTPFLVCRSPC